MGKIVLREIFDPAEISDLITGFRDLAGAAPPEAYVLSSRAFGMFDDGVLVGGFTVATGPRLRALDFVPDHVKVEHDFFRSTSDYDYVESNCTWLDKRYRKKYRLKFWLYLVSQVIKTGKPYYLISFNGSVDGLRRLYGMGIKEIIYEGPAREITSAFYSNIVVSYTTRTRLSMFTYMNCKTLIAMWFRGIFSNV